MASNTRVYQVTHLTTGKVHLIDATSPAAARNFVAKNQFAVSIPKAHDLHALAYKGVPIELTVNQGQP